VVAFCRALVGAVDARDPRSRAKSGVIANPKLAAMISKFTKQTGSQKTFIDRLMERPDLQEMLSKVSWGTYGEE